MIFKRVCLIVMVGFMIFTCVYVAKAAEVTLAWDDPQNPDYGTLILIGTQAGDWQWKHDAGIGTTQTVVANLLRATTYYFAAIHYLNGVESGLSNTVVLEAFRWSDLPDLPAPDQLQPAQNLQLE